MKKLSSRNKVSAAFSMSSMTDLVFLLLIFFIIVSAMVNPYFVGLDLPTGNKTRPNPKQPVTVAIDAGLVHYVNGEAVSKDDLEGVLRAEFDKMPPLAEGEKRNIIFRVDKTVQAEEFVHVLVLAGHNEWAIAISTKPK